MWLPQQEVGNLFLEECTRIVANEELFANFKQNPIFCRVIGNDVLPFETAKILWDSLDDSLKHQSRDSDKVGNPKLYDFEGAVSPGTLYFLTILQELKTHFGDLSAADIVEIGGGHGGLSKIILDSGVNSYSFVDLSETLALCRKYVSIWHEAEYYVFPHLPTQNFDVIVANWSLSEFSDDLIEWYFENLIRNCQFGFLKMNLWDEEREKFVLNLAAKYFTNVETFTEYPRTSIYDNWTLVLKK